MSYSVGAWDMVNTGAVLWLTLGSQVRNLMVQLVGDGQIGRLRRFVLRGHCDARLSAEDLGVQRVVVRDPMERRRVAREFETMLRGASSSASRLMASPQHVNMDVH